MALEEKGKSAGRGKARERILDAAYELFAAQGVAQVGIDKVIAKAGCAKASLYNQFGSKDGLAIAFLDKREELWTNNWLRHEVERRTKAPEARLLAIFDVFDEWFRSPEFEGCSFISVLLETERNSQVHSASVGRLRRIREILRSYAVAACLDDLDRFVQIWHMFMKGSIISAGEGHRSAAKDMQSAAKIVLDNWPRCAMDQGDS